VRVKVGVVGHVEWIDYARVERVPRAGEIAHASEHWSEAGGGGAVSAVQLANLAGAATLFAALGNDELGRRAAAQLESQRVQVQSPPLPLPQRRAFTFVDDDGERTITVMAPKLPISGSDERLPWHELEEFDGVYFVSGDPESVRRARRARVLVATSRVLPMLREAGVELDALVGSASDAGERYEPGDLDPPPRLVVLTEGAAGGFVLGGDRYAPVPPPGAVIDTYGCGDCFAAGLTFGLAAALPLGQALALAARCGATVLTGRGGCGNQYRLV
jgi:ribokinase